MDDARLVRVLKALGDAKRFRMVQEIAAAGELSCGQIAERFDLSQPTISHHMKILTDAGVIVVRREGQHGFASVDRELLEEVCTLVQSRVFPVRSSTRKRVASTAAPTARAR